MTFEEQFENKVKDIFSEINNRPYNPLDNPFNDVQKNIMVTLEALESAFMSDNSDKFSRPMILKQMTDHLDFLIDNSEEETKNWIIKLLLNRHIGQLKIYRMGSDLYDAYMEDVFLLIVPLLRSVHCKNFPEVQE